MKKRVCSIECKWSKTDKKRCKCVCKKRNHGKMSEVKFLQELAKEAEGSKGVLSGFTREFLDVERNKPPKHPYSHIRFEKKKFGNMGYFPKLCWCEKGYDHYEQTK